MVNHLMAPVGMEIRSPNRSYKGFIVLGNLYGTADKLGIVLEPAQKV